MEKETSQYYSIIPLIYYYSTITINELSQAAVGARTEVQKLLTVLEGPVTDSKNKIEPNSTFTLSPVKGNDMQAQDPHWADATISNDPTSSYYQSKSVIMICVSIKTIRIRRKGKHSILTYKAKAESGNQTW